MNGWIIYNGALKRKKIEQLVCHLKSVAKQEGIHLSLVKNNDLLPIVTEEGSLALYDVAVGDWITQRPHFVIYWDKDLFLATHLEKMGWRLFNSVKAIRYCDFKSYTHLMLAENGITMPKTIFAPMVFFEQKLSDLYYQRVSEQLAFPLIIKEAKGSFGMQVSMIHDLPALQEKVRHLGNTPFILQQYIASSSGRDIRVNIVGDKIVGAMLRENHDDFRANITLGGHGSVYHLSEEQATLALRAHQALALDFSGVDLLFGENEVPMVCEVNSNVNYLSFNQATGLDFGKEIIKYIQRMMAR